MNAPTDASSAPLSAYGLREESHSRWQLIEPLPSDQSGLGTELQRLDAKLARLENGSEPDYVKGSAILEARKRDLEDQARTRFDRLEASVTMLFDHECDQAQARYTARCEQLKLDMADAIQFEIRRLQRARDGVAVMDRRRLTRHSGNNGNSVNQGNGVSSTADVNTGGHDASSNGDPSSFGYHVTEKKRMEVLLSATPIFRQLDKTLTTIDVDSDMAMIKESMPSFLCDDEHANLENDDEEEVDEEEERELEEQRRMSTENTFKRRRLLYNDDRLPEGQEVVVYRMASTPAKKPLSSKGRSRESRDSENEHQRCELAAGTVTAATSKHVYLLTADGSFQTIEVDDWKTGRITVHTVDKAA